MKFVPKFKLGFSLDGKDLVPLGYDILLGLMSPFLMEEVEALIILGLVSLS
jgi:hypothetical protein